MASYTQDDIAASSLFAETNNTIRILQKMYEKAPHLTSWLKIHIRDATNDDYYVPLTLKGSAKMITVDITEDLCKLLSCNPIKEQDTCKPNEIASYYYVGDDSYDVQCQPSCYNTATKISYNEDGQRAADIPQLNWNSLQNECRIVNSSVTSWLEKTFYRSDTKFELRVNDMPTGFSKIISSNPYGAGFTYKPNKSYCKYYDKTMVESGACEMTLLEKILDAIIGMALINMIKSSIRMISNDGVPFDPPENLPTLPDNLQTVHTLEGWKNNINPDFVMPELIDTKPRVATTVKSFKMNNNNNTTNNNNNNNNDNSSIHNYRRKAEETALATSSTSNFMKTCMGVNIDLDTNKIDGLDEHGEILQPMGSSPSRKKRSIDNNINETANTKEDEEKKHWTETMRDIFGQILKMFINPDTYLYLGIDITSQIALSQIKSLSVKIVEKMSTYLAKGLYDITGSIGTKVLISGVQSLSIKLVTNMALRLGAKATIMVAKMLGAAASVIGVLLIGTMLLDLLFTFWDPYGYNNMFPPEIPNDVMESGELALRQALSQATANYKFDNLASIILSEDELIEIQLESLIDRLIYLDALVVNSEGSRINKGREINVNTGSTAEMEAAQNYGITEKVKFNAGNFEIYNDRFMVRTTVNKYLNYIAASTVLLSGVFMIVKLPILTMITFIIALIVLALSRLELQDDTLINVIDKYRNKDPIYNGNYGYSLD